MEKKNGNKHKGLGRDDGRFKDEIIGVYLGGDASLVDVFCSPQSEIRRHTVALLTIKKSSTVRTWRVSSTRPVHTARQTRHTLIPFSTDITHWCFIWNFKSKKVMAIANGYGTRKTNQWGRSHENEKQFIRSATAASYRR